MSKSFKNDLTGQRFGRLMVLEFVPTQDRRSYWLCKCDCGAEKIIWAPDLKNGKTKSCGCLIKDKITKHGDFDTRLYMIWSDMRQRCNNTNCRAYKYYGGRGILVCDEWKNSFENFRVWTLNNGYTDELTIDRIDVNSNYEPANCRWVTQKTQSRNTRRNIYIDYHGEKMCLSQAAELMGISAKILQHRYLKHII